MTATTWSSQPYAITVWSQRGTVSLGQAQKQPCTFSFPLPGPHKTAGFCRTVSGLHLFSGPAQIKLGFYFSIYCWGTSLLYFALSCFKVTLQILILNWYDMKAMEKCQNYKLHLSLSTEETFEAAGLVVNCTQANTLENLFVCANEHTLSPDQERCHVSGRHG